MYHDARRERSYRMQQLVSRPAPNMPPNMNTNNSVRAQTIIIAAIMVFAVSGLLLGFVAGALNRPKHQAASTPPPQGMTTPIASQHATPTQTQTVQQKVRLGCPVVNWSDLPAELVADGTTTYTFTAQAMDKSINSTTACGQGKPVQVDGITCRLWLSKIPDSGNIDISQTILGDTNALSQQTIPGEVQGGLTFDPTTPETQPCNAQGQGTWKVKLSPSVDHGKYYIVVLTDWGGTYSNWSWNTYRVTKGNN